MNSKELYNHIQLIGQRIQLMVDYKEDFLKQMSLQSYENMIDKELARFKRFNIRYINSLMEEE